MEDGKRKTEDGIKRTLTFHRNSRRPPQARQSLRVGTLLLPHLSQVEEIELELAEELELELAEAGETDIELELAEEETDNEFAAEEGASAADTELAEEEAVRYTLPLLLHTQAATEVAVALHTAMSTIGIASAASE